MASPRFAITPTQNTPASSSRNPSKLETPPRPSFDQESVQRRDKASLIAHIAKLEAEMYDHLYQMGLLIMERKEWVSKFEESKATAESVELTYKRDQAAHSSTLVEAKRQEDNLKKALEIERECIANTEKSLHDLRMESAEAKVSTDSKLAEVQSMMEDALKRSSLTLRQKWSQRNLWKQKPDNITVLLKESYMKLKHVKMILGGV